MSETQCICLSAILETHGICINKKTLILKYQGLLGMGKNIDLLLRCYVCGAVKFTIHGNKLSAGIVVGIPFT